METRMRLRSNEGLSGLSWSATLSLVLAFASVAASQDKLGKDIPSLAREASPSVVRVIVRDRSGAELATGSGFVVSSDGKVITDFHVVHLPGTAQADARFPDGTSYQVQGVLGVDIERDLAVLKLQSVGKEFRPLKLSSEQAPEIGQHVIAIGSPLAGFAPVSTEATVSDGIVSGIREWPERQMRVLQITAPISPGSSGGALLNMSGEVIGVTFAQMVGGQNLNFAVPTTYIQPLLNSSQLKSFAEVNGANNDKTRNEDVGLEGSYAGFWQSTRFAASGAASLNIHVSASGSADAEIFLTGGEVTSAHLEGAARKTGENIWNVELSSKKPKLHVRGIFRDTSFVGDYTYTRFLMVDQGRWILKKE